MAADGQVEGFRTPGGHLRILAQSIQDVREQRQHPRPVREASPVLLNRRERLEELVLQTQELRAKGELESVRREQAQEEAGRLADADELERQAAERREALALERERLAHEEECERQRQEGVGQVAAFRCSWLEKANELLAAPELRWLSMAQRKEVRASSKRKS